MVLVDTSVLIAFLKGQSSVKVSIFNEILSRDIPFGISAITYQEVLQGARDEAEFQTLKEYLSTQKIYFLEESTSIYEEASMLYFKLRRKGITPRSTLDLLIAATAITNNLALLHDDQDFDTMAAHIPELRILNSI
jgi:predicted nucleic acid-binding protein